MFFFAFWTNDDLANRTELDNHNTSLLDSHGDRRLASSDSQNVFLIKLPLSWESPTQIVREMWWFPDIPAYQKPDRTDDPRASLWTNQISWEGAVTDFKMSMGELMGKKDKNN